MCYDDSILQKGVSVVKESKEARRKRQRKSGLVIGSLRFLLYGGLLALFIAVMSISNWYLLNPSRTLAIVLFTWFGMTAAMHSAYGGYDVGRKKSKPIIGNMALGTFITDGVTYFALQIMNVNVNNNDTLELFGLDFVLLMLCYLLQLILIAVMVKLGNELFFRINPPRDCLIILGDLTNQEAIEKKISRYRLQWHITDVARWDDPDLNSRIEKVAVVFMANIPEEVRLKLMRICYDLHRDVLCKAQMQDIIMSNARQVVVDDAPFLEMDYHKTTFGQRSVKRLMDIGVSLTALVLLSPLLLVIAICIHLEDGGPVMFYQKRTTGDGSEFTICKFRTMRLEREEDKKLPTAVNDDRVTRIGRFLRRFRLDELPQFYNILIGDMSLVGPRPEMLENVDRYKLALPTFVYREKMKAGLTGLAQIEGRYNTSPEDKLMLDLMYIESFNIWMDIKLILRTFTVFFKPESTAGFTDQQELDMQAQDSVLAEQRSAAAENELRAAQTEAAPKSKPRQPAPARASGRKKARHTKHQKNSISRAS